LAASIAASVTVIIVAVKLILIVVLFRLSLLITAAAAFFLLGKIRFNFSNKFARFVKEIGLKQINRVRRRERIKLNSCFLLSGLVRNFVFYSRYKIENN